jgi:hypothetical protein
MGGLAILGGTMLLAGEPAGRGIALLPVVMVLLVVGWTLAQGLLRDEPSGMGRPAVLMAASGLVAALLVAGGCAPVPPPATDPGASDPVADAVAADPVPGIEEPSGVLRDGDRLLVVGDGETGTWYSLPLPADAADRIPLAPAALVRHRLAGTPNATDLEAIDVLADGRVVVLSEDLHALLDEHGTVAEYDGLAETGGRGLEGLAVRDLGDGTSRVAVLWEGGYPDGGGSAQVPRIFVHDVPAGASGLMISPGNVLAEVRLQLPLPAGAEPRAQRFRCPDLVWHRLRKEDPESWGFIVLLSSGWSVPPVAGSSEECPKSGDGAPLRWCYKWIQRFDGSGRPVGDPYDLDPALPPPIRLSNWEGLGWFVPGSSLVLVYDERILERVLDPQEAIVVHLPDGW